MSRPVDLRQYLVPKDGSPLQGLIQDHVIAAVKMTMRGRFFTRADYQQLVYQALSDQVTKIKTVPPTILKPEMLWSGKQIVTTIILNLVPEGKSRACRKNKQKFIQRRRQSDLCSRLSLCVFASVLIYQ